MLQNEVYSGEGRKNGKRIRRVSRAGSCFTFIRLKKVYSHQPIGCGLVF